MAGQVNKNQPRTFGDGLIHMSHLDAMVEGTRPLPEPKKVVASDTENKIGSLIAENLVQDGATLQMGRVLFGLTFYRRRGTKIATVKQYFS